MILDELFNQLPNKSCWLLWERDCFVLVKHKPLDRAQNRETLARFYVACADKLGGPFEKASKLVRYFWIQECATKKRGTLPQIIRKDPFLRMYALGMGLSTSLFQKIWKRVIEPIDHITPYLEPIYVNWNDPTLNFYDVDATPPGILPKLFSYFRIKKDKELIDKIVSDLKNISTLDNSHQRKWLTLAVLSHGAAYREIDKVELMLPSFTQKDHLVAYECHQHLIADGVKTISLVPKESQAPSIYLCQGTELWPSQPSMLGSILANFATHGSATGAYAHSWRRIHKHLRDLPGNPIVAGHSMGGALAMQMGLYSHHLIDQAYAFNPPVPHRRDYSFYHKMSEKNQQKIILSANLDDFAFWKVGAKVIGNVTLFLGKKRWKYHSVGMWDCAFILPAFVKSIKNIWHAFPAHQKVVALHENWISVKLSYEEIETENLDRTTRFDYLHFFPKLYDPMKVLLTYARKIFKWGLEEEYLRNEIELIALHERELIDTRTEENIKEIERELEELRRQKNDLIRRHLKK